MVDRIKAFLSSLGRLLTKWIPGRRPEVPEAKKLNVLFVCTGNTCRSPMAEKIAQHSLDHFPELYARNVGAIRSAGFAAHEGEAASDHSQTVIREMAYGDLTQHKATKLTQELVDWADVVVSMTRSLSENVMDTFQNGRTRFFSMGEFAGCPTTNVPDPYGGSLEKYRQSAKRIEELVILGLVELNKDIYKDLKEE